MRNILVTFFLKKLLCVDTALSDTSCGPDSHLTSLPLKKKD